jgi:hypothetical protein
MIGNSEILKLGGANHINVKSVCLRSDFACLFPRAAGTQEFLAFEKAVHLMRFEQVSHSTATGEILTQAKRKL